MSPKEGRAAPALVMVAGGGEARPPALEHRPEEGRKGQRGRSPVQTGQERPKGHRGGPTGPEVPPAPLGTEEGSMPADRLCGWPASCGAAATAQAVDRREWGPGKLG